MLKKQVFIILMMITVFAFTAISFAEDLGDERKGKYAYRNVYKACYQRGEVDSKKPPISPDKKTQAQWKRIFDKKEFEIFGCKEEWDKLSKQDIQDIFAYLYYHAADSPTPAKCK